MAGSTVSDGALVRALRRGDLAAFEILYDRHLPGVRAAVRDHIRDADDAAEVVQEAFTRALESLPRLTEVDRFRPWVLSIARHTAIDTGRARSRRQPELLEVAEALPSSDPTPAELAEIAELAMVVRIAIGGLSSRDATALGLVVLGFSVNDVARALGINHGAAKVVLHRGRRRLRSAFLLEILARRQMQGCPTFDAIDQGELVAIAEHLGSCDACRGVVLEVQRR